MIQLKQMTTNIKKKYRIILLILLTIVLYLFWGPLFPWNPIKIGYKEINTSKATLYINDFTGRDSCVYAIDRIIQEAEKFHDLSYVEDFKIIILNKESNMKRYLPWMRGSGYSVSLSSVNVIYIGSVARKSQAGIKPYLKHELSHLLIGQNTSFKKALKIHEQGWFAEGIAEYFSGHSFYSKSELSQLFKMNQLYSDSLKEKNPRDMSTEELKLKYSYYRFFTEYLVENYGLSKLQQFLKSYITNPDDYKDIFAEVFSIDLNDILKQYNSKLMM